MKTMEELIIEASTSSAPSDFDFFFGDWIVRNRKLKKRLENCDEWLEFEAASHCRPVLRGHVNTDSITTGDFEGYTLRLFDPVTRLWSIYWADSNHVRLDVPQIGSFDGDIGTFLARDTFNGIPIIVRFDWNRADREHPVWSQAFSADGGQSWEWNWFMEFERRK